MELVISTYGTVLHTENKAFLVSVCNQRQRVPIADVSAIHISKGASITSDAVLLAIDNEIPIVFIDRNGSPKGRVWSPQYGSISTIRKGQLHFAISKEAVRWIRSILVHKVSNQQALLRILTPTEETPHVERAIHRLQVYQDKITRIEGERVGDIAAQLRGWEGAAARIYFDILNSTLPENLRFVERSQHPALDPVNAMLNYGYGILYTKVESALIMAGIDPYIGILHRDEYNRPVLVYDCIEPYRIWVDYVVYSLACQEVVTEEWYSIQPNGACCLEILGKRILIQSLNDYLAEVIDMDGLMRSRSTHINLSAQNLAQRFKQYNS